MKILVTGCIGFIGYHLCHKLIIENNFVIGLDNINNYYDKKLKKDRLKNLRKIANEKNNSWVFKKIDIENQYNLDNLFKKNKPDIVVHLAAQAGVRYSLENPKSYINSNLVGFGNILECCKKYKVNNFLYASSSSVYGGNTKIPFSEKDPINHPVSLYAATKKSNELMAHAYSHLYDIPSTGMRFFTVYGPWGRPDMAPMLFANAIFNQKPIQIFNNGDMYRDFTYIEDVIEVILRLIKKPAKSNDNFNKELPEPFTSWAPHRIFNIGSNKKIPLLEFIKIIEKEIGIKAIKNFREMQAGDVQTTIADTSLLSEWIDFVPSTSLETGISKFVKWYRDYFYL